MEIPYTVSTRPDTGLYNAKVGIWLFLASEVMLFGGLFSSYVFLRLGADFPRPFPELKVLPAPCAPLPPPPLLPRLGADFPWPFHELKVLPGFINTMVLIASSVSVVAA